MFLSTWQMFFNHDQIRADDSSLANERNFTTPTHEDWVMAYKLVNFPDTVISDVGLEHFHGSCNA